MNYLRNRIGSIRPIKMKIELAKNSGFCAGVRNAVNKIVHEINNCNEEILIHGSLIHSPQTVSILEKRGLKIIKNEDCIENQIVAIRTHGTTQQEYKKIKKSAKRIINLTCSNVAYVHGIVKKYSLKGYFTIILGDRDHAEVKAISSFAGKGFYIISALDEITGIPEAEKYLLVSQTTLDINFFNEAAEIIKNRFGDIKIINTICTATRDRQSDLFMAFKKGVDAVIVVGGKNSANTKRLAQIGRENNVTTFHIETEDELIPDDFKNIKHVVVSAGASTPSWIMNNVLEKLYNIKFKKRTYLFVFFKSLLEFLTRTNLFSALATIFMTLTVLPCGIFGCSYIMPLLSAVFIFFMYSINNFLRPYELQLSKPFKYNLYTRYKYLLISLTIISLIFYLYYSIQSGYPASVLYLTAFVIGFIYAIPSLTKIAVNNALKFFIKMLSGVKSIAISLGWTFVALIIPFIMNQYNYIQFISIFIIIFSIIVIRNILFYDLLDYQGDLLLGIETVTTIFGVKTTRVLLISLNIFYIASILYYSYNINFLSILYIINMIYYFFLYKKIKVNYYFFRLKYEFLIDLNLLLFAFFTVLCKLYNPLLRIN